MLKVISEYGDQATGWMVRDSNPGEEKRSLSLHSCYRAS